MQNSNITFNKDQYYSNTGFNPDGSISWGPNTGKTSKAWRTRSFSFTGFGRNDPKKKLLPTAGTYSLTNNCYGVGSVTYYNYYNGWLSSRSVYTGVTEGQVSYHQNPFTSDPYYDSNVYNEALTRLYDQIRQAETNLAVSIGEGRETSKMLGKALRSMGEVLLVAKRAKRDFLRSPSKSLAQIWLSYKYGWLPLYSDVYAFLNFTSRTFDETTFVARRSRTVTVDKTQKVASPSVWSTTKGFQRHSALISVTTKVSDTTAFDRSRITSLNPLSVAWELVPFSFVVDWFVDVGGYLALQEAALGSGLTFKRGFVTEVCVQKASNDVVGTEIGPGYPVTYGRVIYNSRNRELYRVAKRRQVLTGFPRPNFPRFKVSLGSQRILSAASLIRTVLLGRV